MRKDSNVRCLAELRQADSKGLDQSQDLKDAAQLPVFIIQSPKRGFQQYKEVVCIVWNDGSEKRCFWETKMTQPIKTTAVCCQKIVKWYRFDSSLHFSSGIGLSLSKRIAARENWQPHCSETIRACDTRARDWVKLRRRKMNLMGGEWRRVGIDKRCGDLVWYENAMDRADGMRSVCVRFEMTALLWRAVEKGPNRPLHSCLLWEPISESEGSSAFAATFLRTLWLLEIWPYRIEMHISGSDGDGDENGRNRLRRSWFFNHFQHLHHRFPFMRISILYRQKVAAKREWMRLKNGRVITGQLWSLGESLGLFYCTMIHANERNVGVRVLNKLECDWTTSERKCFRCVLRLDDGEPKVEGRESVRSYRLYGCTTRFQVIITDRGWL